MLHKTLSNAISERQAYFSGCDLVVVNTKDMFDQLKISTGLDYRVRLVANKIEDSLFSGMEFDPEKIRTLSVGVFDKEVPVGVLTIVITPKKIFSEEKYYQLGENEAVTVKTFPEIVDSDMPEYLISPAWTMLDEQYRSKIGTPFINLIKNLTLTIVEKCQSTIGIEVIAQGQLVIQGNISYLLASSRFVPGQKVDPRELGFKISQIGIARKESKGSEKFARILGLERCVGIGQILTLGSVFYKRMK